MRWMWWALLAGCSEPSMVEILEGVGSEPTLIQVERPDGWDLDAMTGPVATFWEGSELDLTTTEARQAVTSSEEVRTTWVSSDGVATATDLNTLTMFTAYVAIDVSSAQYAEWGAVDEATGPLDVHFEPAFPGLAEPITDNAFYALIGDYMGIVPHKILKEIPLAMNTGVVAHELGHRITNYELLFNNATFPAEVTVSQIFLRALMEGISDYFGSVIAGSPDFLRSSVEQVADSRDLRVPRTFDDAWFTDFTIFFPNELTFDPYPVGTVSGHAFWEIGEVVGHDETSMAMIRAMRTLADEELFLTYEPGSFEAALLEELNYDDDACQVMETVFAELPSVWEACP